LFCQNADFSEVFRGNSKEEANGMVTLFMMRVGEVTQMEKKKGKKKKK